MTKERTVVMLKSGKNEAVERQHPWIFSGAVKKVYGNPQEGDIVEVQSNKEEFLGIGHWQDGSISVRIFDFVEQDIDDDYWIRKIKNAFNHRKSLGLVGNPETNVYRLIYAEGDYMPGLVIDIYNKTAVIQSHSIGMHFLRHKIKDAIISVYENMIEAVYYKCEDSLPKTTKFEKHDEFLHGDKEEDVVTENGLKFIVNWVTGQKTGFFIDQRYNRELVKKYSKGRKVLNTYCYTGGFSIYALSAGALSVHSVDSSQKAIDLTDKNVTLNGFGTNHDSIKIDAMDYLNQMEGKFDLIILDPPAFAKHKDVKHRAVQGYKRINATALQKINPGGILFTFSCSQVVDRRLFEATVMAAAINSGRKVKVLHHLSQPADHPYSIFHPEGEYLKGLVVYVE